MRIISFIPVRGGSKSIPLKNIKSFCGKPLLYWTAKAAQETGAIDEIIIATDSDAIAGTAQGFRFNKLGVYRRGTENATDISSTESVMLEYLESRSGLNDEDLFILIQATSPLLMASDLEEAIKNQREKGYDSMLSAVEFKRFLWNPEGSPINYDSTHRPRRQDFEGALMENGAFYITTVGNLKRTKNRLGGKIGVHVMRACTGMELDEPEDWEALEALMKTHILPKAPETKNNCKIFLTDVDGVLTDGGMYYSQDGDETKKFNTLDGKAFEILRRHGIKTGIVTGENTKIVESRAKKIGADFLYQGVMDKLEVVKGICTQTGISLSEVAFVGDDVNDADVLKNIGFAFCPLTAMSSIKEIPGIVVLDQNGGSGVIRRAVEYFGLQ